MDLFKPHFFKKWSAGDVSTHQNIKYLKGDGSNNLKKQLKITIYFYLARTNPVP